MSTGAIRLAPANALWRNPPRQGVAGAIQIIGGHDHHKLVGYAAQRESLGERGPMFDRWFESFTEVVAAAAAAAELIYMGREIKRRQKKLRNLFDVLGPDSAVMADHLEELARRGVIRPYRPTTAG